MEKFSNKFDFLGRNWAILLLKHDVLPKLLETRTTTGEYFLMDKWMERYEGKSSNKDISDKESDQGMCYSIVRWLTRLRPGHVNDVNNKRISFFQELWLLWFLEIELLLLSSDTFHIQMNRVVCWPNRYKRHTVEHSSSIFMSCHVQWRPRRPMELIVFWWGNNKRRTIWDEQRAF